MTPVEHRDSARTESVAVAQFFVDELSKIAARGSRGAGMTKIIIIVGFLVAFGAGLVVGIGTHRVAQSDPTMKPLPPGGGPGWLTRELKLRPISRKR